MSSASRCVPGGEVAAGGPEVRGPGAPRGATGGQVCPMRCRCAAGEVALLAQGAVSAMARLKARQHGCLACQD